MICAIKGVGQTLSFETGETVNYIQLQLPSGVEIRAIVAGQYVADITNMFLHGGSEAAELAKAQAVAEEESELPAAPFSQAPPPMPPTNDDYERMMRHTPAEPQDRPYAPLDFQDGGEFGGDYEETNDPSLAGVEESLRQAEAVTARAIGDTSTLSPAELRQVAKHITSPAPVMPVPNVMTPRPATVRKLQGPRVEADAMGNPIISGAGLVDPRALAGGNTEGEEDVGQV